MPEPAKYRPQCQWPGARAMTIEALQAKGLKKMDRTGIHSATVPGCVRGWEAMHRRHGKLAWNKLFDSAIHLAGEGFPMQEMVGRVWESDLVRKDAEGTRVFYPNGKAPLVGEIYRNPDLGESHAPDRVRRSRRFLQG